ncbi:tyrosine-type recombinase/integrase [Georgenia sp.]
MLAVSIPACSRLIAQVCRLCEVSHKRHTGATWMADAGVPLHVLQQILGHASIETTRGYLHPDHRHLASAAKQANAFLAAPTPAAKNKGRRGPAQDREL